MSVALLLVSHPGIASSVIENANHIWPGNQPELDYLEVPFDADTQAMQTAFQEKLHKLDQGDGVLIICDIAGASPCNITAAKNSHQLVRICGLSLPMLLKAYNYQDQPIDELACLVIEAGNKSILQLEQQE